MSERERIARIIDPVAFMNGMPVNAISRGAMLVAYEKADAILAAPSPVMKAAEKAAERVAGWSDSKRAYADRVTGATTASADIVSHDEIRARVAAWGLDNSTADCLIELIEAAKEVAREEAAALSVPAQEWEARALYAERALAAVVEALEPFAKAAEQYDDDRINKEAGEIPWRDDHPASRHGFTVGLLRAARVAISFHLTYSTPTPKPENEK